MTIGLKSVENPLEFGIVVTDEDGRVERFLEKPSWGQVFSDTINTGIYVVDAEVMNHVPTDRPYDFSKELFPLLLEMGRPIYGYVMDGYWQDIGNLDQYRQANFDALDEKRAARHPRHPHPRQHLGGGGRRPARPRRDRGPGLHRQLLPHRARRVGRPVFRARRRASRCASARASRGRSIDSSTYIGRSAVVEGAIVGRACDLRAHTRVHEGVAIGDEVTIGAESVIMPGVRIYPYKEVETGSHIFESLIWESRGTTRVFGKDGVSGLVNVDLTPDIAVRLAAAFGTALKRGARVVASREGTPACRMIKRAMISGLSSTGVDVADLRVIPAGVGRHLVKTEGYAAGFHVGISPSDPEAIRIQFFELPGIEMTPRHAEGGGEALHARRAAARRRGRRRLDLVSRARARELRDRSPRDAGRGGDPRSRFRLVVDYGFSASSYVLPLVLGPLGVEAVAAHAFPSEGDGGPPGGLAASIGQAKRLVPAVGADLGAVFDRAGERLYLIDEQAHEIPVEQALLLYLSLIELERAHGQARVPRHRHEPGRPARSRGRELEIIRTRASLPELTKAAVEDGVVFAGAVGGGYVFPDFLPGYDAVASLAKLLELLATIDRPISELVAELPAPTLVHRQLACPWALKGLIMRVLNERMAGREVDLTDGIKVFSDRGWAQVLPDPDEPLVHLYAEGETIEESEELADELRASDRGDRAGRSRYGANLVTPRRSRPQV